MHIGDRSEIEQIITTLHNPLKLRLRFLHSDKHPSNDPVPTPPLLPAGTMTLIPTNN